ncbi:hypothetical protein [Inediibacterium massiliense]|nr:hypothetical protein [Inediibacterium massiliense]
MKFLKLISVLFGVCVVAMVIPVLLWVLIPIGFICWKPILMSVCETFLRK